MGKKNKKKSNKKAAADRNDGAIEIKRAEERLTKAISDVEVARQKVARRERDLAEVLARHGRIVSEAEDMELAIPLEATASHPAENGAGDVEDQDSGSQNEVNTSDQQG
jgi:hypothetical protein